MKNNILKLMITLFFGILLGQENQSTVISYQDFQISSEKYLTDNNGNISMFVNVWGSVTNPGHHLVYDGIDFATLLAIVGGPLNGANLKRVKLYREIPEADGSLAYTINLQEFLISGDRSNFVQIKPNDTILIPRKIFSSILSQIGTVNTLLSLLNLYIALQDRL